MKRIVIGGGGIALLLGVMAVGFTAWTQVASPVPVAGNSAISKNVGPPLTCAATNQIIGYLGELRSGVATGASAFAGVATATMMSPVGSQGTSGLVTSSVPISEGQASELAAVGGVDLLAKEATLRSCDYMMSDSPRSQPYIASAEAAIASAGLVSLAVAQQPIAVYLADDPLHSGWFVVTVGLPGPVQTLPDVPSNVSLHAMSKYVVVETGAASPVAVGRVAW